MFFSALKKIVYSYYSLEWLVTISSSLDYEQKCVEVQYPDLEFSSTMEVEFLHLIFIFYRVPHLIKNEICNKSFFKPTKKSYSDKAVIIWHALPQV